MKLEDLRDNLGSLALYHSGAPFPDCYIDLTRGMANTAFYSTLDEIRFLEQSDSFLKKRDCALTVAYLFLSVESYIMDILKIISIDLGEKFKDLKKGSLSVRYMRIIHRLGYKNNDDISRELNKQIIKKLDVFSDIRHSIFHNNQLSENIKCNSTFFSKKIHELNQIDVIQSIIIAIDIFNIFRFSINNLDIMPLIAIESNHGDIFWEKFDIMYNDIIKPCFMSVLKKHGLSTDLNLKVSGFNLPESKKIKQQWKVIIKAKPDIRFDFDKHPTTIVADMMNNQKKKYEEIPEQFALPDYTNRR